MRDLKEQNATNTASESSSSSNDTKPAIVQCNTDVRGSKRNLIIDEVHKFFY